MIFHFYDLLNNTKVYVCPDQQTIAIGQAEGYVGDFVLGTQADAQNLILPSQNKWINENASLISVNESIVVDGGVQWVMCDLDIEPENTDGVYEVFDVVQGTYTQVVGLSGAKELVVEKRNSAFFHFNPICEMENFLPLPPPMTTLSP